MDPLNAEADPVAFFDVAMGGKTIGRIQLRLYSKDAPKTSANFLAFCNGTEKKNGNPIGYKGCLFHRIIKDFVIQGGDFVKGDGTGRTSIYGNCFDDETFVHKHDRMGLLSMANSGPNTNGCQFFITLGAAPWLDGKHVVFGEVVQGLDVVKILGNVAVDPQTSRPKVECRIVQCGQM